MTEDLKRTPLADAHRALGAKMVPFAGWEMPVQYPTGILAEHRGLFSAPHCLSHQGGGTFSLPWIPSSLP